MTDISLLPGHLIRRLQQIAVATFANRMSEVGLDLTPVQYAALAALDDHPRIDQATLASLIAYDRVTLGGVVDRLSAKGLVTRSVSPTDRRARVIDLTKQGHTVLRRATSVVLLVQDDVFQGLTPEEAETLVRLMTKAMRAHDRPGHSPRALADPPHCVDED